MFNSFIMSIFNTLAVVLKIYFYACLIRIFLSWVPQMLYSQIGTFLRGICDPYLDFFREKLKFLQIGMIDFSPLAALTILSILSETCALFANTGIFSPLILALKLAAALWSIISFILNLFIIMLIIRLILEFSDTYNRTPFTEILDSILRPITSKIYKTFFKRRFISYKLLLGITASVFIAVKFAVDVLFRM